jgi:D-alanine-D-alanine ligase
VKSQRVLVLVHPDLVPPEDASRIEDRTGEIWKTEYDVLATVGQLGHEVRPLGVFDDLGLIRRTVEEWKPTIAFNLLEEFGGEAVLDQNVVSYLETLRVPHTGCNPLGLMLARDKALSKQILASHRIRVPRFQVFQRGRVVRRTRSLTFPIFLKSLVEDASLGISLGSIVEDDAALTERVRFIHEQVGTAAIGEQFIAGHDLYVGVLGNDRLTVFPPLELDFTKADEAEPMIATRRAKFDRAYQQRKGILTRPAQLPAENLARVQRTCRRIFKILNLNGYARLDFRITENREIYFIEANPNPDLARDEDFAESAGNGGIGYEALIGRIIHAGLKWRRGA